MAKHKIDIIYRPFSSGDLTYPTLYLIFSNNSSVQWRPH
jgi:hypothetical protein